MIKRLELWGVWFDVDVDYTLGRPAITCPIDRAAPTEPFRIDINAINHCGDDMTDLLSEAAYGEIKHKLIEDVVNDVVGDDSDYKHEMHRDRRISETT